MTPKFGNLLAVFEVYRDVIDARPAGARALDGRGDQPVAGFCRGDEGDLGMLGHRTFVIGVAGKGERRICKGEDEPAVAGAVAVGHVGPHDHRHFGGAGRNRGQLHAE